MSDSFPLFLCRKHILPETLQPHPWAPGTSENTRRFLRTRANGLCPRTGLFLVHHLARHENQPKRQPTAAWSSLKASNERTIINKTLSVSQPRRPWIAAWSSLKASYERIIINKTLGITVTDQDPMGPSQDRCPPPTPTTSSSWLLSAKKHQSKNKFNQRSGKTQKQRKSVVKDPPANRDLGPVPGWGRSPGGGNGKPLQHSWESHGRRSLAGYSPWGHKSQTQTHTQEHLIPLSWIQSYSPSSFHQFEHFIREQITLSVVIWFNQW